MDPISYSHSDKSRYEAECGKPFLYNAGTKHCRGCNKKLFKTSSAFHADCLRVYNDRLAQIATSGIASMRQWGVKDHGRK